MSSELHAAQGRLGLETAAFVSFSLQLARVRHDLRGCVGQILGFSELLIEDAHEHGRKELLGELQRVQQLAAQMIARINERLAAGTVPARVRQLPALQSQFCEEAARIIALADNLKLKSGAADEVFKSDLDRISGAARHVAEVARNLELLKPSPARAVMGHHRRIARVAGESSGGDTAQAEAGGRQGSILVVDDLGENRELLRRRLSRLGYTVHDVESGESALEMIGKEPPDLILLDIFMPELDGFQVLQRLKQADSTRHIPVVMLSSADEVDTVVRCISMGADDFLPKPFNPTLLMARIESSLSKKRLRDQEAAFLKRLQAEQEISERLLLNILPKPIAERLKAGETNIADAFQDVTVLFSDFVGFTRMSSGMPAKQLVEHLNTIFSEFDCLCEEHGLEKIKMIGDAYMAVGGLPTPREHSAQAVADVALEMQGKVRQFGKSTGRRLRMRIGLNTGAVVAGVIGMKKFAYDLWGDTVNLASRMETLARPGGILVASETYARLKDSYSFKPVGFVPVKGRGRVRAYELTAKKQAAGKKRL